MSDLPSSPSTAANVSSQSATPVIAGKAIASSPGEQRPSKPPLSSSGTTALWAFGILLPAITIIIEAISHVCAATLFDPIPTWWQLALVSLVPIANFAIFFAISRGQSAWLPRLAHLNGFALGVSLVYLLLFLPVTPVAVVGVFFGVGLLALCPLLSFWASTKARRALLAGNHTGSRLPRIWPGFIAGILALALPHTHDFITRELLAAATSSDAAQSRRSVGLLRALGSRDCLLRSCYVTNDWTQFMAGFTGTRRADRTTVEEARTIYYRVTGEPYNSVPAPAAVSLPGRRGRGMWNIDDALGGSKVANKVPGLSMISSRLDGKVEAADGTSYLEWTMLFKNVARNQSEARAQIELPPGAVVSRLTLWIDGEPREAAFGGRSQVRTAYQQVAVQQRRDPVLVTTCGPDRVLVQCFPVQPNGGEMKVRIGITAPLRLTGEREGAVSLPRFLETNFEQDQDFAHEVWIESDQPMNGASSTVRRSLREEELRGAPGFPIALPGRAEARWAGDPTDPGFVIRQTVRRTEVSVPSRVVFVIDGSKAMATELGLIAETLRKKQTGRDFAIVFAGDEPEVMAAGRDITAATAWLRARKTSGGRDNLPALERAWDLAATNAGGAIVWLHGPQPVLLSGAERLLQRTERERNAPLLYNLAKGAGPNRIVEQLDRFRGLRPMPHGDSLNAKLEHLLALWSGEATEFSFVRERTPRSEAPGGSVTENRHIARLWGLGEIERLAVASGQDGVDRAIQLALQLQLVTRVSGAVVLEQKEQYARAGLTPVDPATVPTIPEPGTTLLVLLGGGALLLRRRRSCSPTE